MSKIVKNERKLSNEDFHRFSSLLQDIESFVNEHENITYIEFDYFVVRDMTLFSVEPDFDFKKLEEIITQIKKSTSAMKRIFNKPIIILQDNNDVVPVENARTINQNTLLHLANHSHYVSNITKKGVKPRKLLTRIYEDDYSIYENVIFCNYVDEVLSIIKKNRKTLNSLLYASSVMKFNLLEKLNHLQYYLAIGKLHTGYIRDFSQYFSLSKELLKELSYISSIINARLNKPIYRKNKKRNKNLKLKKTNIFLAQKDYKLIYKTYKHLLLNKNVIKEKPTEIDFEKLNENYMMFVQILTIFAVGHFNFEMTKQVKMNLKSLDVEFKYKDWHLAIYNNNKKEIILQFKKDKTYKMIIVSSQYTVDVNKYKKNYGVDEVIIANQFEEDYIGRDDMYISMEDVDSFRRIQQIILRGMIYADRKREVCPFCGGKLHKDKYRDIYQCDDCMTQIKTGHCDITKHDYIYTDNAHLKKYHLQKTDFKHDDYWYYEKQVESAMYFRNITKINESAEIICPHCKNIHQET